MSAFLSPWFLLPVVAGLVFSVGILIWHILRMEKWYNGRLDWWASKCEEILDCAKYYHAMYHEKNDDSKEADWWKN